MVMSGGEEVRARWESAREEIFDDGRTALVHR